MKFRNRFVDTVAIAALALAFMSPVQASPMSTLRDCHPDAQKFCSSVEHGDGRVVECLKQHQEKLSPACASDMKAMTNKVKDRVISTVIAKQL